MIAQSVGAFLDSDKLAINQLISSCKFNKLNRPQFSILYNPTDSRNDVNNVQN